MEKVVNARIGGRSFVMDEDAYSKLKKYLEAFRRGGKLGVQSPEVMEDLEERISELFSDGTNPYKNVVDVLMVQSVISQLGMPDGEPYIENGTDPISDIFSGNRPSRKLYRNPCNKSIAGVCSGIAAYLNIDILLVRIIFIVALILGSSGFWVYVILWIAVPLAQTSAQMCELYGVPATEKNMKRFRIK